MVRFFAFIVVAALAACGETDDRIDRVVFVHEDRMDAMDKKIAALTAEVEALRAQCAARGF